MKDITKIQVICDLLKYHMPKYKYTLGFGNADRYLELTVENATRSSYGFGCNTVFGLANIKTKQTLETEFLDFLDHIFVKSKKERLYPVRLTNPVIYVKGKKMDTTSSFFRYGH